MGAVVAAAAAGGVTLAGWLLLLEEVAGAAPPPPPPHAVSSSVSASRTKAWSRRAGRICGTCIAWTFIFSIASSSYVFIWGRRQHTSTCERGVPSVGCTSPHAAASDSLCAPNSALPGDLYGGKAEELSRRM